MESTGRPAGENKDSNEKQSNKKNLKNCLNLVFFMFGKNKERSAIRTKKIFKNYLKKNLMPKNQTATRMPLCASIKVIRNSSTPISISYSRIQAYKMELFFLEELLLDPPDRIWSTLLEEGRVHVFFHKCENTI